MPRIAIVHWKPEEAEPMLEHLNGAGYDAQVVKPEGTVGMRAIRDLAPAALVIDLSRLPSHGKAVAEVWRGSKATRYIPILFSGGASEKVESARAMFPDAEFCRPDDIVAAVRRAIRNAPETPVVRQSMSGYSGTPLPKKLGIKPGTAVLLLNAPQGFLKKLEPLPEDVRVLTKKGIAERILLFANSRQELDKRFPTAVSSVAEGGGLWIVYPKQKSGIETDLTQFEVRKTGMDAGWVDYKICAIDETWTGLCFARRAAKARRAAIPSK